MSGIPAKTIWPALAYDDPLAAIRFLVDAFGFEERLVVPGEGEGGVAHAELVWPEGGGVMLGSANDGGDISARPTGSSWAYVVTDEPDRIHDRATAAGAKLLRELRDEDYGSRGFTVADPEGNVWSFGTYRGAPPT